MLLHLEDTNSSSQQAGTGQNYLFWPYTPSEFFREKIKTHAHLLEADEEYEELTEEEVREELESEAVLWTEYEMRCKIGNTC